MNNSACLTNSRKTYQKAKESSNFLGLLFFVEMWERFSYYGMRVLLVLFLTSQLGFADSKAYAIYSLFAALGYALPVVGGIIADKLMGFRNMVLIGSIIMMIGHACMTFATLNQDLVYLGLSLIAVGTGLFKGNITNLLGSCYKENDPGREKGFTLFYVAINLGSFSASILCGLVANKFGWNYGFALAGLGMLIGLITFIKFQHILGANGISPKPILIEKKFLGCINLFTVIIMTSLLASYFFAKMLELAEIFTNILSVIGVIVFAIFANVIIKSDKDQRKNLIALSIMIFFFMCFFLRKASV
jgi:POT family proton-dependent oligopeptide transporter